MRDRSGWRTTLRSVETRLYRRLRHPAAERLDAATPAGWDPAALERHRYCLLVSFRRDGTPVPTPVWFALDTDGRRILIRSGASDGKVKRIRRDGRVLVAPCTFFGRPLGEAMEGQARILRQPEHAAAEAALRTALGLQRRVYAFFRDRALEPAYIEVGESRR